MKKNTRIILSMGFILLVLALLIGLFYGLILTPDKIQVENTTNSWMFICVAAGGLLLMAVYSFALYLFRSKEKAAIFFALFCIGNSIRFFTWNIDIQPVAIQDFFQSLPYILRQICVYLMFLGIAGFVFEVFGQDANRTFRKVIMFVPSVLLLGTVQVFWTELSMDIAFILIGLSVLGVMIWVIVRSPVRRSRPFYNLYLVVFAIYIVSFLSNATFFAPLAYLPILTNYLFAIVHIIVLADRYAVAITAVEQHNERLEQVVTERTAELRQANDSMKELISNISHDLKTPLTVMGISLEKLNELAWQQGGEFSKTAHLAYSKSLDLSRLTGNLFEASRIETGRSIYESEPIPLSGLFGELQERYGDFVEGYGLFFELELREDGEIMADPQKIWSVFDNLIYNAVRYTKTGGITITAEQSGNSQIVITVRDTGKGVLPEHLPHLLERFYKVSSGRGGEDGDSGLGLYIVKTTMEGMGGSVRLESEMEKGFVAVLTLLSKSIA